MRDPLLGEIGILILIIGLGLYILLYDHFNHDDNDDDTGGMAI